jgi:two-component SAPR family response regulator
VDEAVREYPDVARYAVARRQDERDWRRVLNRIARRGGAIPADDRPSRSRLNLRCLGQLEIEFEGESVRSIEWRSASAIELLIYLISRARPVRASDVGLALWPDLEKSKVESRFHSNLYRLRRALRQDIVVESQGRFSLNPEVDLSCDLLQFEKLYAAAVDDAGSAKASDARRAAIELYRGSLAPELPSEWSNRLRQSLEAKFIRILIIAADDAAARDRLSEAIRLCMEVLDIDEEYAPARRRLIRWLNATVKRQEARTA